MLLTILMPCLNEAETLATCIRSAKSYLARSGIDGEVLIADNGSADGSQAIALAEGARVLDVPTRGYGAALRAGIDSARGKYVVMGDSDNSYDFSRLDGFVDALRGGLHLVIGNRFAGGIAPGAMPRLHKYLGNPVLSFVGRLFFQSPIRDFHCGLRGFDRQAMLALGLQSHGMEFASEMIVKATLGGLKISEVPTTLSPDGRNRPPHLRSWRDGWRHLRFLLIHAPAWLFLYPGTSLLGIGLTGVLALSLGPLPLGAFTLDIHSLLYASLAASLGLQMLMFAGASSLHAVQIGILPKVPASLAWIKRTSLERFLLVGLGIFTIGLAMAILSVIFWSRSHFAAMDPSFLMRIAIPAATLMMMGGQVATSAFLVEYIRLAPRSIDPPLAPARAAEQMWHSETVLTR
jgi:glycosyltransferase involved in cell wall biosynthesis